MISVVIPLYNNVATIASAINSVLSQTISDFELIVVDDGSTDGGREVVEKLSDNRIKLVSQPNRGVSAARNLGIEKAKGEWIAFLDADDEWKPSFLSTVLSLNHKYPECSVCATAYERLTPHNETQHIILNNIPDDEDFILENYFEVAATSDPPFCSISVMVRREALMKIGRFPVGIHQGEDLLTWAKLAAINRIAYSRQSLAIFHTSESHSSGKPRRTPPDDDIVGRELEQLYKQHTDLPGLPKYLAHWHKMRASMFLRLENSEKKCRNEIHESQKWHRNNKLIIYHILSFLPYYLRMKLIDKNRRS